MIDPDTDAVKGFSTHLRMPHWKNQSCRCRRKPRIILRRGMRLFHKAFRTAPGFSGETGRGTEKIPPRYPSRHELTWLDHRVRHRGSRDEENPWASKLSPDARIIRIIIHHIRPLCRKSAAPASTPQPLHHLLSMTEERSRTGGDASLLGTAAGTLPFCLICYDCHCNCTVGGISSYKDESSLQLTVP